jgi:predicted transposase/invertase (TIGR01784 family)
MTTFIHQPQDKLFKQAMADLRVARDFFNAHLPQIILEQVDLNTLKMEKQSFIDETYKATEADVLYSVKCGAQSAYFYLLCEHQSNIDQAIALRLLIYMVRIIERYHKLHPKNPLPLVYPLVVYTGEKSWDAPLSVFDLFGENKILAEQIFLKPYQLIDVQRINDEDLYKNTWIGLTEFALKHQKTRDFNRFLDILLPWLEKIYIEQGSHFTKIMLTYVADGVRGETRKKALLIDKAKQTKFKGEIMTIAEEWVEEGITIGLQQGMQRAKTIIHLLHSGKSVAEIAAITELSVEQVAMFEAELQL